MHTLFKVLILAICLHRFQPCNGKVKIQSLFVPRFVENGTKDSIIIDCSYTLDPIEDRRLVVKLFLNDDPEPIYQWIPEDEYRHISMRLQGRVNMDFKVNTGDPLTQYRAINILRPTIDLSGRYACHVFSLSSQDSVEETMIVYAKPKSLDFNYKRSESDLALRSLQTEHINETQQQHNSGHTSLNCHVSDVSPLLEITIYRVSDNDSNVQILLLNTPKIEAKSNGAFYMTVTSDVRDNELTEKYDSHENKFVCDVRLSDGTQNIYQTNKSINYFTGKPQYHVLNETKTIAGMQLTKTESSDRNDTNNNLSNLKLILDDSINELIESIKLHANTTDFEYFKAKIIHSVVITYTALENCKTELINTKTLLENSNSANFANHKNDTNTKQIDAKQDINSTKSLLLLNNQSNNDLNKKIEIIKTKTDINSIAFNDCQSSDVWIDCKLFVDSKKNMSQIIARPKYLNDKRGKWNEAMNICEKYNYSLLSIESKEKQLFVYHTFGGTSNFTTYWTSGRKNSDGKWIWNNSGNEVTYNNWGKSALNSPNDNKTECISITDYWWTAYPCHSNFGVMCEFDIDVNQIPETTNREINNSETVDNNTELNDCLSNDDVWTDCKLFTDSEKNIIQIIAEPKQLSYGESGDDSWGYSWAQASNMCAKYNTSLISIESEAKQKFIETIIGKLKYYWTSGCKNYSGKWLWFSNGNEFTYNNWDEHYSPNDSRIDCLSIHSDVWDSSPPRYELFVICEFNVNANQITSENTNNSKTDSNSITINNCQLSEFWDSCELFFDSNKNITQIIAKPNTAYIFYTWDEAMDICAKHNSSLVSLESEGKQKFVSPFVGKKQYWTSGRKNSDAKWLWNSTGDKFTFTNWDEDYMPNTTIIECLTTNFEKWHNALCDEKWSVLCEFQINV